jgi:hypothetical protein
MENVYFNYPRLPIGQIALPGQGDRQDILIDDPKGPGPGKRGFYGPKACFKSIVL